MSGGSSGPGARAAAEREEFNAFFPQIVRDLTEDGLGHPEVGDAVTRLKQVSAGRGRQDRAGERGDEKGRAGGCGPALPTSLRSRRCWSTTRRAASATGA